MTSEMTPERFRALAEAYGASLAHWPSSERAAALEALERRDPEALAALAKAQAIDALLALHTVEAPRPALVRRVLQDLPRAAPAPERRRARLWWSGIGFAGVGAAGLFAGALVMSLLASGLAVPRSDALAGGAEPAYSNALVNTAFGGASDWSDE